MSQLTPQYARDAWNTSVFDSRIPQPSAGMFTGRATPCAAATRKNKDIRFKGTGNNEAPIEPRLLLMFPSANNPELDSKLNYD